MNFDFLRNLFSSKDDTKTSELPSPVRSFFEDESGNLLTMDGAMERAGYERIRLRGAEIDEYAPIGTVMVHLNCTHYLPRPASTAWGNGDRHGGLLRIYRRTEEIEDDHIIFVYSRDEDR